MTCPNCGFEGSYVRSQCPQCSETDLEREKLLSKSERFLIALGMLAAGFGTTSTVSEVVFRIRDNRSLEISFIVGLFVMALVDLGWARYWNMELNIIAAVKRRRRSVQSPKQKFQDRPLKDVEDGKYPNQEGKSLE